MMSASVILAEPPKWALFPVFSTCFVFFCFSIKEQTQFWALTEFCSQYKGKPKPQLSFEGAIIDLAFGGELGTPAVFAENKKEPTVRQQGSQKRRERRATNSSWLLFLCLAGIPLLQRRTVAISSHFGNSDCKRLAKNSVHSQREPPFGAF